MGGGGYIYRGGGGIKHVKTYVYTLVLGGIECKIWELSVKHNECMICVQLGIRYSKFIWLCDRYRNLTYARAYIDSILIHLWKLLFIFIHWNGVFFHRKPNKFDFDVIKLGFQKCMRFVNAIYISDKEFTIFWCKLLDRNLCSLLILD